MILQACRAHFANPVATPEHQLGETGRSLLPCTNTSESAAGREPALRTGLQELLHQHCSEQLRDIAEPIPTLRSPLLHISGVFSDLLCFPHSVPAVPFSSSPEGQRVGSGMQVGVRSSPSMGHALLVRGEQLSISPIG